LKSDNPKGGKTNGGRPAFVFSAERFETVLKGLENGFKIRKIVLLREGLCRNM